LELGESTLLKCSKEIKMLICYLLMNPCQLRGIDRIKQVHLQKDKTPRKWIAIITISFILRLFSVI